MGLLTSINSSKVFTAASVLILFVLFTPLREGARTFFLNVLLTSYLVPSLVLYAFADEPTSAALLIWLALGIVYAASAFPFPRIELTRISPITMMWFLALASFGLIFSFFIFGGFRYFNLDFSRVYDLRREAAEDLPGIFAYLYSVFSKTVIPFGITVALLYRNYLFVVFFFCAAILLFGLTTHKSILFTPIVVLGVFFFLARYRRYSVIISLFIIAIIAALIAAYLDSVYDASPLFGWYESLFMQRVMMVPPLLDYFFLEFFSENPKYFWSDSRVTFGLVGSPYGGITAPFIIGEAYFDNVAMSANAGFIGSGYSQAGIIGVVVYAICVGLTVSIFQTYGRHLGVPFVAASMLGQFLSMSSATDFLTMFLTHGLLLALIILTLVGKPGIGNASVRNNDQLFQPKSRGGSGLYNN